MDNLAGFLRTGEGATAALRDTTTTTEPVMGGRVESASDPMRTGIEGPQPTVFSRLPKSTRRHLAKHTGVYRALVEKPARDAWSAGWAAETNPPERAKKLEEFDQAIRVLPSLKGVRAAFRRAHRLSRRDGKGFVLIHLRDSTSHPKEEPRGVQGIHSLRVLSEDYFGDVQFDEDPRSPRWGFPKSYDLLEKPGDQTSQKEYHWSRIIPFIEEPDEEQMGLKGENVLEANLHNAQGTMNVQWAGTEAYYQRAAPYLVVEIDKEVTPKPSELDDLDEKLAKMQQGVVQKIRLRGATIKTLNGSEKINDPTPFMRMHREDLAAGSGIPIRDLTGSEAGQLAAAEWDERRYRASVVNVLQDEFCESIVREWYDRLMMWGLVERAEIIDIAWPSPSSLSKKEEANRLSVLGDAAVKFAESLGRIPRNILDELEFVKEEKEEEEDEEAERDPLAGVQVTSILEVINRFNDGRIPRDNAIGIIRGSFPSIPEEIVQSMVPAAPSGPANSPALAGATRDTRKAQIDSRLRIWASDELRDLEDGFERLIVSALREWRDDLDERLEQAAGERVLRDDARDRIAATLLNYQFESDTLTDAWARLLLEAASLGATESWESMGMTGVFEFVQSSKAPEIKTIARDFTDQKRRAMQKHLRQTVSQSISDGESLSQLKKNMRDMFGRLENEATIARTEAMRGYNMGARASLEEAGVETFEFLTYPGQCEICAPLNGKTYTVSSGVDMNDVGGDLSDAARSNLSDFPPIHPNCRCSLVAAGVP